MGFTFLSPVVNGEVPKSLFWGLLHSHGLPMSVFSCCPFYSEEKVAPHEAAFSPQRNPVPSHPLCPMSSVSAWSTAAAVRGTTARARHESPVISAEIDDEVLDFSAVFPVDTEFYLFPEKVRGEKAVPSFDVPCPVLSFLMRILEIYGAGFFKTAGLSCPSTI